MGRLATVFNETLGRLEGSFEQMRQFTADVSHELRTPLTAIRSVGEVGLREHRDDAAYRAIIGSMLEEVDRLASLVDRLLTLSRAETGQSKSRARTSICARWRKKSPRISACWPRKRSRPLLSRATALRTPARIGWCFGRRSSTSSTTPSSSARSAGASGSAWPRRPRDAIST